MPVQTLTMLMERREIIARHIEEQQDKLDLIEYEIGQVTGKCGAEQ